MRGYFSPISSERHRLNVARQALDIRDTMDITNAASLKKKADALETARLLMADNQRKRVRISRGSESLHPPDIILTGPPETSSQQVNQVAIASVFEAIDNVVLESRNPRAEC